MHCEFVPLLHTEGSESNKREAGTRSAGNVQLNRAAEELALGCLWPFHLPVARPGARNQQLAEANPHPSSRCLYWATLLTGLGAPRMLQQKLTH